MRSWAGGTDQREEGLAHPPRLDIQRLDCPLGSGGGESPGARIGWRGFLAGSGGPIQPPTRPPTAAGTLGHRKSRLPCPNPEGRLALEPFITCSNSRNAEIEGPKLEGGTLEEAG